MERFFRISRAAIRLMVICAFLSGPVPVTARITLPQLISDGMVLQRDVPLKINGWASPGEKVTLTFKNKKYRATAGRDSTWLINLPAQTAGGPWEMTFKGENTLKVTNILFGDVWICAGQSNMVLPMERVKEKYGREIAGASFPAVRHFFIPTVTNLRGPQKDLPPGSWKEANPRDVLGFSAVAYFFGKAVHEKYGVPVGLVNASVGGTPIEAWISEAGFREFPGILKTIETNKVPRSPRSGAFNPPPRNPAAPAADRGQREAWQSPDYIPVGWKPFTIPGFWEDQGIRNLDGVVWFRREIDIPVSMAGLPARLFMGRIVDSDFLYVNGRQVGNITYQYPPRRYTVPEGLLKAGKNLIVVRVTNDSGKGGFVPDKPYFLEAGGHTVDLRGEWHYKVGEVFTPRPRIPQFSAQNQPAALFNAMVAPVTGYAAKGFLWYQGETNAGNAEAYREYLPALIRDWRNQWNQGDLPFLFVQLANFMEVDYLPAESQWAELREAQRKALGETNTAMAVTIDLGEWNDIHPLNKKEVGERLALGAFRLAYGDTSVVWSGPLYQSHTVSGDSMLLVFDHVGSGLVSRDGEPLARFEVAGADGKYFPAEARITGDRISLRHHAVARPERARYAWADNPDGANLYNKAGLPASPFQTWDAEFADSHPWRGKSCAVVLTYDDGLNVHLDQAIRQLDAHGMKGTFYIPGNSVPFRNRSFEWKRAAANGHELGNHTLFHPCDASLPGRSWVNPENDLSRYSVARFMEEIKITNLILEGVDGKKTRSFAYTCGDTLAGGQSFVEEVMNEFPVARGVRAQMENIMTVALPYVGSFMINGESGEQLIGLVKKAMESHSLLVFLFHGVGGEHDIDVSAEAHRELLQFLKENDDRIWVTTMLEAATHITKYRKHQDSTPK
ncbi:MAG TPA: sialate O-acetylesterase [Prolixibacteraceae bacterium]|nr:MAG: Polysaccharide deacetylase [Bacteroidetes bacterium ADurb.Bin123]HNU76909.1 sialate O-acetylesterase [Prolixibacteraceae bacterium]HPV17909.1 sialate O-acetylesterase [Prolixibacteraceae bacterium]